jgi:HK97 family phage portal protein
VHRAVRLVAENVGAVTYLVYDGAQALTTHPLLDLIAQPNPREDRAGFLEAVTANLMIAGNAYLEAVSIDGAVRELYALRPDRMRVVPGPDGWPQAYDYTVGGQTVRFAQSGALPPVLHLKLFHPLDDHYGLAPLEAAAVAVEGGDGNLRFKASKESASKTLSLCSKTIFPDAPRSV